MLSFILLFCFVGCNDDDYSDDIDALKKELEEKRIELEHVRGEREELQRQLDKANKDLEDLLKA